LFESPLINYTFFKASFFGKLCGLYLDKVRQYLESNRKQGKVNSEHKKKITSDESKVVPVLV
jgi:hypothetical protein